MSKILKIRTDLPAPSKDMKVLVKEEDYDNKDKLDNETSEDGDKPQYQSRRQRWRTKCRQMRQEAWMKREEKRASRAADGGGVSMEEIDTHKDEEKENVDTPKDKEKTGTKEKAQQKFRLRISDYCTIRSGFMYVSFTDGGFRMGGDPFTGKDNIAYCGTAYSGMSKKRILQIAAVLATTMHGASAFANDTQAGIHNSTTDARLGTTNSFRKSELQRRNVMYTSIIGISVTAVFLLAVMSVYRKKQRLALGPLSLAKGRGLMWRDKPLCGKEEPNTHKELATEDIQDAPKETQEVKDGDGELVKKLLAQEKEDMGKHGSWLHLRRILLTMLFLLYVGASIGIPAMKMATVSCNNGFFWEDHMPFLSLFIATKLVELSIYVFDPTIRGNLDLLDMILKFLPSFLGYVDGYTDSTAIVIAHSCPNAFAQTLSLWMVTTYTIGVVLGQWIVVAILACKDPTQACLMKLLHMDALASCVSLPEEHRWIWTAVNLVRTFGENMPQAVQQTLFLLYVKENYFMICSVVVSVAASLKAVYDAINRAVAAVGAEVEGGGQQEWTHDDEISEFPVAIGTLNELGMVDSSFVLQASVWRDPEAPDTGGQYVSDQAVFGMNEYGRNLTCLHVLVRDGRYIAEFYRSGYAGHSGPQAAKGRWEDVEFILDKEQGRSLLKIDGVIVNEKLNPPLDANRGNDNQLLLGQYAGGRRWKGKMKNIKVKQGLP